MAFCDQAGPTRSQELGKRLRALRDGRGLTQGQELPPELAVAIALGSGEQDLPHTPRDL